MKAEWRRFAPLGLYLAGAAVIAAAVLYILQREWNLYLQISLGLVVLGLALFAVLDPDRVRVALTGRQARYGSNALILSIAFIGILVVINYLIYTNSRRWDLTEDKQFTLAAETIETLQKLPEPVQAEAFYTPNLPSERTVNLLDQYQFHSDGKFTYELIDPLAEPVRAQQANITRDGTVVLIMGDRQAPVTTITEQNLTEAMVRLINPESRAVYFLTGHGEHDLQTAGDQAYTQVKAALEGKNYAVKTLNLLAENKIPEDAKVIVIGGPQQVLSESEMTLLKDYLAKGGAVVVMEEPLPLTQYGDAQDPLTTTLQENWGIILGNDFIIDTSSSQPAIAVGSTWGTHSITSKLTTSAVLLPSARSVTVGTPPSGTSPQTLVSTSAQAWGETDMAGLQSDSAQIKFDEGVDLAGPVGLAVVAENFDTNGRVVVFGDSDFITDSFFSAYGNGDLFINSVDWAAGQENLINLTPKNATQRLVVPPQRLTMNLILLGMVIFVPGLALIGGLVVWLQRRRRG